MKIKKSSAYALHALAYMVRHRTQLPATTETISKAEGIPSSYLAKIFQKLVRAHFVKAVSGKDKGYIFDEPPEDISLLRLFETLEGGPLFDGCFLKHCKCGGTPDNCHIFSIWINSTKRIKELLEETTVENSAWNHPDHRFNVLPGSTEVLAKK